MTVVMVTRRWRLSTKTKRQYQWAGPGKHGKNLSERSSVLHLIFQHFWTPLERADHMGKRSSSQKRKLVTLTET